MPVLLKYNFSLDLERISKQNPGILSKRSFNEYNNIAIRGNNNIISNGILSEKKGQGSIFARKENAEIAKTI